MTMVVNCVLAEHEAATDGECRTLVAEIGMVAILSSGPLALPKLLTTSHRALPKI